MSSISHANALRRILVGLLWAGMLLPADMLTGCRKAGTSDEATSGPATEAQEETSTRESAATAPATQPLAAAWKPPRSTERQDERDDMVRVIRGYGLTDGEILRIMGQVPRHKFVPDRYQRNAYDDTPLPIGYGQTISQPYIVAEMTRLLGLDRKDRPRVLEIGTGSGYQAAVLSHLTPHVYTLEIIQPLAESARQRLKRLGYETIQCRHGDGYFGWPEHAPFDAIVVTAAAGQIPPPLLEQLAPGGRMVIPIGGFSVQSLMLIEKDLDGTIRSRSVMGVQFVPFIRGDAAGQGW